AFDADHIAAIDNTTRKLLQQGKRPLGVGFFFSLGHSTIVFALATGLAVAAKTVNSKIPTFQDRGGYVGARASGTFLRITAVLSLPVLVAAGMSLMDTADGAFMSHAYGWAFSNPVRKVYYNITVTSLSVAVALVIGTVELTQVVATKLALDSGFWGWTRALDFGTLGYGMAGLFVLTWAVSVTVWKTRRIEERWGSLVRDG